jgi:outer membrane protein assembly factor BamA
MSRALWRTGVALGVFLAVAAPSEGQEPQTRQEALRRQREEKSQQLAPPERSGLERALFDLESGRLLERLLNPAEGFYPKIGNITAGSGFSFGPAYRKPGLFGGHADFSAFAAASFQRYWMLDTRVTLPRLANERISVDVHAQRYEFPDEDFFGLGPDSQRTDEVAYGVASSVFGGTGSVRPRQSLTVGAGLDYLTPHVSTLGDGRRIDTLFNERTAPGLATQPDFLRYELFADLNYREPRGNPRRGGRYAVALERFDDRNGDRYSFRRVEADLQQYVSMLNDRRVLALHAVVSTSDADPGREVPFYFLRTLGGPDDLRGFRRFRFRDRNMLLLQAEYRWEIFTAVDGAIFYDAGKVAPRLEDLTFSDLESDVGIGFRFGTINGVFLRVEGAFGSREGKHFILRFGHVF